MEITVVSEFQNQSLTFTDKRLTRSTNVILKNMKDSKESFCAAARELMNIRDKKLFAKDFVDPETKKPSFTAYCENVLGISKSQASRIIITGTKLLAPEIIEKSQPVYFQNFGDTNLSIIAETGETYEECKEFCVEYDICETTLQKDIREAAKDYKTRKKMANVEPNEKGEGDSTTVKEHTRKLNQSELHAKVKEMFESDINKALENYPDYTEVIQQIIEKW